MKWIGRKKSKNIEDRRRFTGSMWEKYEQYSTRDNNNKFFRDSIKRASQNIKPKDYNKFKK